MKTHPILLVFSLLVMLVSCDNRTLNTSKAASAITVYLEEKPIYESAYLTVGETKLRTKKDHELIDQYKLLEAEGYITFTSESSKKRWLSKDSIWNATLKLTEKAHPYVIEQKNNKIKIKTIEYKVDTENGLQIDSKGKKSALVTAMLQKKATPFSFLKPDKNPHTEFITKKFRMKFSDENGWKIIN
ncbi:hypothetical protein [Myroides indicus]|uniref:Uncharacterized protein n=1 Tax=Myroides indicus TaxID=1323422 RepID=A0A4R7ESC7_9FLAO|nr:hypothetical protein [Myroides indicus]TDS54650.1 hypothetical protein C8P70_12446 [Myroides indicus]